MKEIDKNKDTKVKKDEEGWDEPGLYEEFRPFWGPGSSYKPWIYGK